MARYFPTGEPSPHHPLLSYTFLIAFIASIVTIISSLCGFTKKKQPSSPTIGEPTTLDEEQTQNLEVRTEEGETKKKKPDNPFLSNTMRRETEIELLPPPPGMGKLRASSSYHVRSNSNESQIGKLSTSMSMRSIGAFKKARKKEAGRHAKNKLSHEDSVWKKTIILGEKCRVPDDEEEAVVYDEKGRRIPTFHRKQSKGLQISRQNSTH